MPIKRVRLIIMLLSWKRTLKNLVTHVKSKRSSKYAASRNRLKPTKLTKLDVPSLKSIIGVKARVVPKLCTVSYLRGAPNF